jgi:hypothetical protein
VNLPIISASLRLGVHLDRSHINPLYVFKGMSAAAIYFHINLVRSRMDMGGMTLGQQHHQQSSTRDTPKIAV